MNRSMGAGGSRVVRDVAAWVPLMARLGYAAKGVVYGLVGWIAMKAGLASGGAKGPAEALGSLADESGGQLMLTLIAIGLLCHVAWRVVQALLDPEHPGERRPGMRVFYAMSAVLYLSLAVTAWQLAQGGGSGGSGGQEIWVARLLEQPFGSWLVMLAGVGVMVYGVQQLIKAFRGDVNRHMQTSDPDTSRGVRLVGRIGTAARGVVLLPIGWFVFRAGRLYRAEEAADTGEVLQMLGQGWLLALVGLGLLAYGLHQLAKAAFRRIRPPA